MQGSVKFPGFSSLGGNWHLDELGISLVALEWSFLPWRTLAAIINKCLFGKTRGNDRLKKSRIDILLGMFYRENVDYPELIWEDFAFQIDHRKEKKSRRETMSFPRFTKVIINHFLSQHKSLSKLKFQHYHTIKDDGIVSKLKSVRIGEDYQEYGLLIPDMMLNDKIKHSDSYQMFLKYSTGLIPPKKCRDKGSQRKKTADVSQESVDISDESEPKPAKKKTGSRSTMGVVIQDTPSALKPKPFTSKLKLKGVQSLTPEEQEATDTMQALKESKKSSRRQPGTRGSSEGTGRIPRVPYESTVVSTTSSEGTRTESEHSDYSQINFVEEEKKDNDGNADDDDEDEDDDHISDIQDIDNEDVETEFDKDEIYKYKIQVHKDVDVEMVGAETVERENKEKDEMTDAGKANVEKTAEEKGDVELAGNAMISDYQVKESTKLPLPSSSLSVSYGFGIHVLNLSSDVSLAGVHVSVIPETTTLPPIPEILTETSVSTALSPPHVTPTISIVQQTTTPIPTPPIITEAPTIITVVPESNALADVQLRVTKLEKDMSELKKIDHSAEALASLKSQVPMVVEHY
ncbi:hypothetical protein Tco_1230969, partial [Tanacetum coccineum]